MSIHEVSIDFGGKKYSLETGKYAKQANGTVMVRCGDSMVLVTAVCGDTPIDRDFLPLQVEYREKTASAGKIPGGFLKREGRPSDREVLSSRLIDRPTRPLFPKTWRFETQIIATVFSFDPDCDPDTLAAVGTSAALMISDIPFKGPFSEVRVGRIDGELVINPSVADLEDSDIDLMISGTDVAITMVEGESKEISEEVFLEALEFGHEKIKELNALQMQLFELTHKEKIEYIEVEIPDEFKQTIVDEIGKELHDFTYSVTTKEERNETRFALKERALAAVTEKFADNEDYEGKIDGYCGDIVKKLEKAEMRSKILDQRIRLDGRKLDEIRDITCEIGVLPRAHGSALFTRGETQSLTTVTLGTGRDEQMVDGLLPKYTNHFYLHYNFPPFCTGEVKRLGVSRREVGHGNLAERALKIIFPTVEDFGYVTRVVSDILESNGSSSMATVCAGSLAIFDAGIPMKKPVAGIAMGLIHSDDNDAILSDILGDEDFLGDMDFKVTGTVDGITACQMDIKIEGLSIALMKDALAQAKEGRMHILGKMNEAISAPNTEFSAYAPRFTIKMVPKELIGAIIGSGGETIRSITKDTGCEINIDDDGKVTISSASQEDSDAAIAIIDALIEQPEEGKIYQGVIKEIREGLGAFVEFMPKKQGLLHISQISWERTENVGDVLEEGQEIDIKLLECTRDGKFRLSLKALQEKPEGYVEPERKPRSDNRRGGYDNRRGGGYNDRRGGGGGDRRDSGGDRRGGGGDRRDSGGRR